jgi:hypothetical protein
MVSLLSDGWQKDAHVTPMKSLRAIDYLSRKFERKSAASGDALYFYDLCTILMHSTRYLGISTSMRIDCFSYPARRVRNTLTSNEILTIPRHRTRYAMSINMSISAGEIGRQWNSVALNSAGLSNLINGERFTEFTAILYLKANNNTLYL